MISELVLSVGNFETLGVCQATIQISWVPIAGPGDSVECTQETVLREL
jgi:hypothetical protein